MRRHKLNTSSHFTAKKLHEQMSCSKKMLNIAAKTHGQRR